MIKDTELEELHRAVDTPVETPEDVDFLNEQDQEDADPRDYEEPDEFDPSRKD